MKARIRATGDIYNVIDMNDYRNRFKLEDHNWYTMGEIELIEGNEPDWQHYRIQAAIAAMQAHLSDGEHMALLSRNLKHDDEAVSKCIAKAAVMYADALVAELKKGG